MFSIRTAAASNQIKCILYRYNSTVPLPSSHSEDIETLRSKLRGTVPNHQSLLLLHTKTNPEEWPTDMTSVSPMLKKLTLLKKEFHGNVIMCYPGNKSIRSRATNLVDGVKQDYRPYTATFFTKLTEPLDIPRLDAKDMSQWIEFFKERTQDGIDVANMLQTPEQARSMYRSSFKSQEIDKSRKRLKRLWLLVCTHRARDCRCGEHGVAVAKRIREYIKERGLRERVICGEVSHVGGHRYAANVLVYPHGEWYGTVRPEHVDSFMDSLLGVENADSLSGSQSPLWRGSWFDNPGEPVTPGTRKRIEYEREFASNLSSLERGE